MPLYQRSRPGQGLGGVLHSPPSFHSDHRLIGHPRKSSAIRRMARISQEDPPSSHSNEPSHRTIDAHRPGSRYRRVPGDPESRQHLSRKGVQGLSRFRESHSARTRQVQGKGAQQGDGRRKGRRGGQSAPQVLPAPAQSLPHPVPAPTPAARPLLCLQPQGLRGQRQEDQSLVPGRGSGRRSPRDHGLSPPFL